ncbi:hypothetical protein Kfla_1133 [Kribbella flavida DSM 17836]|uniref:N-acetyltransferase domain-containing protein n=1 Tax=Kribbella flavida (strain DSM 17836 / JCM 10339 / NBRC 14399) TaxID=479435 RepID=D2Q2Q6_KRIFD|nr:GNAT family N-acetyltransferase [Kribbella flavida]ADB30237.1 hypothetical protein Kfla_1133 [Kribbella flavida DSM 17836]
MTSDDERLLELEIDTIFGLVRPRPAGWPRLATSDVAAVFGWSPNARVLALSAAAAAVVDVALIGSFSPDSEPAVVTQVKNQLLNSAAFPSALTVDGGPCYVFPATADAPQSSLPIVVSDDAGVVAAQRFVRPDNWEVGEWRQLISGELGSWAMAVDGLEPVSICHTPTATPASAEAGVWTRMDHRGAGLAAAVAVAWWKLERLRREVVFYSTSRDNVASQSVAAKLGLQPLGWLWTVR